MSTAVMRPSSLYDFDLLKSSLLSPDVPSHGTQLTMTTQMEGCRGVRFTLSRMNSSPTTVSTTNTLVNNLLGNLTQQHRRLERTQSAPAPSSALSATSVNTSRYKTELCRPFEEFGVCKYGDKCQFAHGPNELRTLARHPKYKTELCRTYHTVGFCPYGPRCHFVHNQDEVAVRMSSNNIMGSQSPPPQRLRPTALSPSLSLESPSSPCSLSQSPTSSMGSFFSSDPELNSPGADEQRLPVFNRIAAPMLGYGDLLL